MSMFFRAAIAMVFCSSIFAALRTGPALADDHLPIIDLMPNINYGLSGSSIGPVDRLPLNGELILNGTVTLPVIKNLSLSYDNLGNGAYDAPLSSVAIAGHTIYPGGDRDIVQQYRADYRAGPLNFETGFGSRYRECCPADFLEWHKYFWGVSYTTRHLVFLHGGFLVLDLTANGVRHFSSAAALAALPSGLSLPNNTDIFTTEQSLTAIVPVNTRAGIHTATTFLWGALDYPQNGPFPQYYDVVVTSATKQVTDIFGLTLTIANVKQRIQGYPFPAPNAIRVSALTLAANFKLDFRRMLGPSIASGPSILPGVPGGPSGPAPIDPQSRPGPALSPYPQ